MPGVKLRSRGCESHVSSLTSSAISSTTTPDHAVDQIFRPNIPSLSASVESESEICSVETEKRGSADIAPTIFVTLEKGIEFYENGQYKNALELFITILKSEIPSRGESNNILVGDVYANIGLVYLRQGRHQHALEYLEEAIHIMRRAKSDDFTYIDYGEKNIIRPSVAGVLNNIGTAKSLQGDYRGSLEYYWEALRTARAHRGSNKTEIANSFYNIGRINAMQNNFSFALKALHESLCVQKELYGEEGIEIFDTLSLIGYSHYSVNSSEQAMSMFTEALAIAMVQLGSMHEKVAISLLNISMVLEKNKDFEHAFRCSSSAQHICEKVGLGEENRTMRAAVRSVNGIRQKFFHVKETGLSRSENEDEECSFFEAERMSCSNHEPTVNVQMYHHHSKIYRDREDLRMSNKLFGLKGYSDGGIEEYREDPFWELDNSSIVAESRDD